MRKLLLSPLIAVYGLVYGFGFIPTMAALALLLGVLTLGFAFGGLYLMFLGPFQLFIYMLDNVIPPSWPVFAAYPTGIAVGVLGFVIGFGIFLGVSRAALVMIEWVSELKDAEVLELARDRDFRSPRDMWRGL